MEKNTGKKIVAFCCENSALKAAEALSDPGFREAVELVRLPCTGKAETGLLLAVLERGHPAVLVLGCPKDNCQFLLGSTRAEKRVQATRKLLKEAGLNQERVHMQFVSSVDSHRLASIVRDLQERLSAPAAQSAVGGKA